MVRNKHSNTWKPPILGTILSNICFPSNSILNITSNTLVYIAWSTSRNKWGISSCLIISSDRFITVNITFMSVGGAVIGWRYPLLILLLVLDVYDEVNAENHSKMVCFELHY